jgi:hypothetical protein
MLPNALKEAQASAFQFSGQLGLALCVIGVTQITTKGVTRRYESYPERDLGVFGRSVS